MKYAHVVTYVASSIWAIDEAKLNEILAVLAFRAAGNTFSVAEIEARIGAAPRASAPVRSGNGVAVIPIRGTIAHRMSGMEMASGGASTEAISRQMREAAADPSVGTIVYDIDSPGGTVTGVSELAAEMFALRGQTRQIAHVNGMAASAAYWLAAQADEIVSIPSGMAGSIGVFSTHANLAKALEQEGVDVTVLSAGKYKVEGSPFGPLSDEAKAVMQARVDEAYGQFVADVARGRGVSAADVRAGYGQGRALRGPDAVAAGLVDRLGSLDETVAGALGRSSSFLRAEAGTDHRQLLERF